MTNHDLKRSKANKKILSILSNYLGENPTIRFSQALINLGLTCRFDAEGDGYEYSFEIIDYYEEPDIQLNRAQINQHV